MKAWEDIEASEITPWRTSNSSWYLDLGARIERFDDGRIVIKNTMAPGENYKNLSLEQAGYFEREGWDAGRYKVCMDECKRTIEEQEIKGEDMTESWKKYDSYKIKFEEALLKS